jgi:TolB protein
MSIGQLTCDGFAQTQTLGQFSGQTDVGPIKHAGSVDFDKATEKYVVTGSGANTWFGHDEFHFVWKRLRGDFIVSAHAQFLGDSGNAHRKLGWMARRGLQPDAPYVDLAVHGDGLASLQFRRAAGNNTEEIKSSLQAADIVQLERKGDTFIMSVAQFGQPMVSERLTGVDLGDELYVGIFVCAHDAAVLERAQFENVRITIPAKSTFVPYRDYIGSNLEILELETGRRSIIHQAADSIQAPNWKRDGESLIFNSNGRLIRFDLKTGESNLIDTGFATKNNNDHVLSFDGQQIGISNHAAEDSGRSIVYTLPAEGGIPRKITPVGPSYLHGWSPDGQWLVYTGDRSGNLDVYKIPVTGGEEVRLTDSPGVDDGAEFTPDGQWIYFNSNRSGRMQIWRMRADGSEQQRITHDDLNNWFPHISPDGRRIIFLSFSPEVPAGAHPFYENVYLRIMPIASGEPKVVAYLYGGQGTINVPSWSPDSQRVAFVSNTVQKD